MKGHSGAVRPDAVGHHAQWPLTDAPDHLPESMPDGKAWPKISLIVPNYNYGHFIEETLLSILNQGYPNLELIVMDGGSSDHSVEIIRKYERLISYWESKPDRGQAHAINKGLKRVTGALVNWVNSDDVLLPGSLAALATAHRENPEALIAGDVIFWDENGIRSRLHHESLSFEDIADPKMDVRWMQPGIFVPTHILSGRGDLDESLRYQFDREWMLSLSQNAPFVSIDDAILRFRVHDEQRSLENLADFFREGYEVMGRYISYLPGRDSREIPARYHLAMAGLFLASQPRYAPYWNRMKGIASLFMALFACPALIGDGGFLRLLRRALLPKWLFRSRVD